VIKIEPVRLMSVFVLQFRTEEQAEKAVADLNNRWFNCRPIIAELSPVTDFREACCRQYELGYVLANSCFICFVCLLDDGR
jgi:hypothetical protein